MGAKVQVVGRMIAVKGAGDELRVSARWKWIVLGLEHDTELDVVTGTEERLHAKLRCRGLDSAKLAKSGAR